MRAADRMALTAVWIVTGWFGSDEWTESVHATEASADAEVARLWVHRRSENAPDYCQGLCKFGSERHEVKQ